MLEHGRRHFQPAAVRIALEQLPASADRAAAHGEHQVAEPLLARHRARGMHRAHRRARRAAVVERRQRARRRLRDWRGCVWPEGGQAERDRLERVGGGGEDRLLVRAQEDGERLEDCARVIAEACLVAAEPQLERARAQQQQTRRDAAKLTGVAAKLLEPARDVEQHTGQRR